MFPDWLRRRESSPEESPQTAADEAAVAASPDCKCGHARSVHTGTTASGLEFFDGPCQVADCVCTDAGYWPGDGRSYSEVAPPLIGEFRG